VSTHYTIYATTTSFFKVIYIGQRELVSTLIVQRRSLSCFCPRPRKMIDEVQNVRSFNSHWLAKLCYF